MSLDSFFRRRRAPERRRLERQDTLSGRLAELHEMDAVLGRAIEVVERGWVQGAWFTVSTRNGNRDVAAYDVRLAVGRPVVGACLVGGVVHGGGGPGAASSQLVRRTLDLTWHTLHRGPEERVAWCPGPSTRMLHVLDLTRWNDQRGRTQQEVVELLAAARQQASREGDRCLDEALAATSLDQVEQWATAQA